MIFLARAFSIYRLMMATEVKKGYQSNAADMQPSESPERAPCSLTASSIDPFTHVLPMTLYDKLIVSCAIPVSVHAAKE